MALIVLFPRGISSRGFQSSKDGRQSRVVERFPSQIEVYYREGTVILLLRPLAASYFSPYTIVLGGMGFATIDIA